MLGKNKINIATITLADSTLSAQQNLFNTPSYKNECKYLLTQF